MKKKDFLSKTNQKDWEEYIKDPKDIFDKDRQNKIFPNKERYKFDLGGKPVQLYDLSLSL